MGYRVKRSRARKELRNKKLKNKSILIAIVFIVSIISNSIAPKTHLFAAIKNSKFIIDNVSVQETMISDNNIFNLAREAEIVSENEIKVSLNIKINKDNIPTVNSELAKEEIKELADNEIANTDENKKLLEEKSEDVIDESIVIEKSLSDLLITESLIEGFSFINDSIKLEEVTTEGNIDLTSNLINSEYTDLSMESLENKFDIKIKNINNTEVKLSYLITTNNNINVLENVNLFSESLLKYHLVESDDEKTTNIPNVLVWIKDIGEELPKEEVEDKNEISNEAENKEIDKVEEGLENNQIVQENNDEAYITNNSNSIQETVSYDLLDLINNPTSINFPVTIRDFNSDGIFFEASLNAPYNGGTGMVSQDLGTNKKPVFLGRSQYNMDRLAEAIKDKSLFSNGKGTYDDAKTWYDSLNKSASYNTVKGEINTAYRYVYYYFNSLFNDVSGLNTQDDKVINTITLNKDDKTSKYTFNSSKDEPYNILGGFFPLDNKGFGNYGNSGHNFHFTLESHSKFWVGANDNLEFNFTGDDDVWVYVNGKLVIDLGGVHSAQSASFKINNGTITRYDSRGNTIGIPIKLSTERWVNFDFFYMERHTTESNLNIETNIQFKPNMTVEKQAYLIDSNGDEVILNNNDKVYPGETVYYKFIVKNKGNVDLTDIKLEDEAINIKIDKNGVYKKNENSGYESINYNDLTIIKNGILISDNKLSELGNLALAEGRDTTIEIKSKDFLKYTVKESDIPAGASTGNITNRVVAKANYYTVEEGSVEQAADATVTVIPTPITDTIVKLNAIITKTIDKIIRKNEVIYPNTSNKLPNLLVGDKVTFKFNIENESTSRNMLANGQVSEWIPIAIEGLKLEDKLAINSSEYSKSIFEFYTINNNTTSTFINSTNFSLDKNSIFTLYSDWTVTESEANYYNYKLDYDVINTVKLSKVGQGAKEFGASSVQMKIQPPSISIQKVIANDSLADSYSERTFTIMVNGDNGKQYNIEAKAGEIYKLENLKYGVTYTVSEIVPMNYQKQGISVNGQQSDSITLTAANNGAKIQITNKKINDKFWSYDSKVVNSFIYKTPTNTR